MMKSSTNNLLNTIVNNVTDDCLVFAESLKRMFWEVADQAERTRSRQRHRRELARLGEQETAEYRQLGLIGFQLLRDQVAVRPTSDTSRTLAELDRLRLEQRRRAALPEAKEPETPPVFWRRMEESLQTGELVINYIPVPDSSPWCGRSMTARPAAGLCFAFKRGGQAIQPFTPNTICLAGDMLIVLSPATTAAAWDRWIMDGSLGNEAQEGV